MLCLIKLKIKEFTLKWSETLNYWFLDFCINFIKEIIEFVITGDITNQGFYQIIT